MDETTYRDPVASAPIEIESEKGGEKKKRANENARRHAAAVSRARLHVGT